jgi:hypothetical protein
MSLNESVIDSVGTMVNRRNIEHNNRKFKMAAAMLNAVLQGGILRPDSALTSYSTTHMLILYFGKVCLRK